MDSTRSIVTHEIKRALAEVYADMDRRDADHAGEIAALRREIAALRSELTKTVDTVKAESTKPTNALVPMAPQSGALVSREDVKMQVANSMKALIPVLSQRITESAVVEVDRRYRLGAMREAVVRNSAMMAYHHSDVAAETQDYFKAVINESESDRRGRITDGSLQGSGREHIIPGAVRTVFTEED